MAKKIGKNLDKKPDTMAQNEPEKQAGIVQAHKPDKKIPIAVILLALVVLGGVVIIGSSLLNASRSPELPAGTTTTPTTIPELPAGTTTTPTTIPKLPAGTTTTPTTIPKLPAGTTTTLIAIYFYGNTCAACEKVKPLLADIQARYPELHIEMLEVNDNRKNMDTFVTMRHQYGVDNSTWFAIPSIFIGNKTLVGEPEIKDHFEEYILAEKQRIATGNPLN